MKLALAIEASSATYAVALGTPGRTPGDNSKNPSGHTPGDNSKSRPSGDNSKKQRAGQPGVQAVRREAHRHDPDFAGVGGLVSAALASVGGSFADVGCIAVDVGPGNLTSVRAAVAYANGLAFSLGVMVYPVTSLELMAAQVSHAPAGPQAGPWQVSHAPAGPQAGPGQVSQARAGPQAGPGQVSHAHPGPVLCMRKGDGGNAYAGLFGHGEPNLRYGQLRDILPAMAGSLDEVTVAGAHRDLAAELLPQVRVHDSGVDSPDVLTLYQMLTVRGDDAMLVPAASAVNEGSREFHGHTALHR